MTGAYSDRTVTEHAPIAGPDVDAPVTPWAETDRPFIWITPARQGGAPCVGGTRVPAATIGNWVVTGGGSLESSTDAYGISRDEAICAVWWFMERFNPAPDRRTKFGKWLEAAHKYLASPSHWPDPGEFPKAKVAS